MTKRANGEGGYTKRPDGRWQYRTRVEGRRVSGSGRLQMEAKAAALARAEVVAPQRTSDTWADLFQSWVAEPAASHELRPLTKDLYAGALRRHVIPVVGDLRPEDTTTREVAAALNVPLGASYRNSLTAAFRKLGRYAVQRGATRVNVAALVPRPPVARSAPREASSDDMARVLKAAEGHRWELAAWLVVLTGLRRGEIPALRWRDVDLATGSLTVCGAMTRSSEGLQRGEPKTKRGNRRVPIPGPLREQIAAHRKRQNAERLAAVYWEDTGYVLTSDVGTPVDPRNLSREWSLWAERAGLADRGMHLGRHFAATELLGSGLASVADVAAQLGHDPGVLLRTYASAVSPSQRAAAEYLAESLGTANGSRS